MKQITLIFTVLGKIKSVRYFFRLHTPHRDEVQPDSLTPSTHNSSMMFIQQIVALFGFYTETM